MMNDPACSDTPRPADSTTIKAAILYDEFSSGVRAKRFAERLASSIGSCRLFDSLWRNDLLESPRIAAVAALEAADFDYMIVSLCGDQALPYTARQWIDSQLDGAGGRGAGVILLSTCNGSEAGPIEGARRQLRAVCDANGVAFFSHTIEHDGAGDAARFLDEEEESEVSVTLPQWKWDPVSV